MHTPILSSGLFTVLSCCHCTSCLLPIPDSCTGTEDAGDSTERDQRRGGGERGAEAAQRDVPGHQQLHQDRGARAGGVRQELQVAGGAPAGDAPDGRRRQGVPARRGARHRLHHAEAPAPGDGLHGDRDGCGARHPRAVPRPPVPRPPRLLGRRRQVPAGEAPGAEGARPRRRRLLREQLPGGVLRLLRRLLHLLVGAHGGRRRRLLRRRERRRGHLGRRPGPREPGGQVLRRRLQRELCWLRLATITMTMRAAQLSSVPDLTVLALPLEPCT
uniref:Uncharacterized protein n=1 Tax=Oryza sativa subsp. japonica TaxID=39947 RepID=Q6Z7V5_ORYSJ|nr:unknown protein [Oryza sativa Japonica Group]